MSIEKCCQPEHVEGLMRDGKWEMGDGKCCHPELTEGAMGNEYWEMRDEK